MLNLRMITSQTVLSEGRLFSSSSLCEVHARFDNVGILQLNSFAAILSPIYVRVGSCRVP